MQTNNIQQTVDSIDLFQFFRVFFSKNDNEWNALTDKAKMTHAFMLNRFLSIKHPEYIQFLNKKHSVHIIDALHNAFKHHGKSPGWMYTKAAMVKTQQELLDKYPKILIHQFVKSHNIEAKAFSFLLDVHEKEVLSYLDKELKTLNQSVKKTKK